MSTVRVDPAAARYRHRLAGMVRRADRARTHVRQTTVRIASGGPLVSEMTETATKVAMAMNTAVEACDKVVDQAGPTEILNDVIAKQLGV